MSQRRIPGPGSGLSPAPRRLSFKQTFVCLLVTPPHLSKVLAQQSVALLHTRILILHDESCRWAFWLASQFGDGELSVTCPSDALSVLSPTLSRAPDPHRVLLCWACPSPRPRLWFILLHHVRPARGCSYSHSSLTWPRHPDQVSSNLAAPVAAADTRTHNGWLCVRDP